MALFVVSTPIGNLGDITYRAVDVLKSCDYVLCEDTRVTGKLLNKFQINKRLVVLSDFKEEQVMPQIISDLSKGLNIALVSDAGTPLISDPGFKLVRAAVSKNIEVISVPGPTAAISALTISGLPTDKFLFLGFLPKKDGKRAEILRSVLEVRYKIKTSVIIYESPYRVNKLLSEIKDIFGDIEIVVSREITKMHEEVKRGKISEVIENVKAKGEFVVIF